MYPPETSLIPVTVSLAKFVESNGIASMVGHYPYWYLGVPYQYLTGPIVPLFQLFLHNILPQLSLFEITYIFLFLSFLASIIGWGVLVYKVQSSPASPSEAGRAKFKVQSYLIVFLLLILPWRYLSALALSEASVTISKNLLPFVLLAFWQYYKKRNRKNAIYAILALSVLLLINTTILAIFAVGISALIFAASFKKGKFRGLTNKAKKTVIFVTLSIVVVTIWYTPGYWMTVLTNPSIGGASGIKVFLRIFDLLRASIPLVLAIGAVYFSGKIKNRFTVFSLTWVFAFLFLTVFRFIGDPDFWQDWTAWLSELEIGAALLSAKLVVDISKAKNFQFSSAKRQAPLIYNFQKYKRQILFILVLLIIPFVVTNYVYGLLNKPKLITDTIPEGVRILAWLEKIAGGPQSDERVFLSGSTVFWVNALYDLSQVRGGVDKAATHPYWDHASFQLREGNSPELAKAWLQALGVSRVLVHTSTSAEVYHDFRNIDKWNKVGDVVWKAKGDVIFRVRESSHAWVVDLDGLDSVSPPEGGVDLVTLNNYLSKKKRPLQTKSSVSEINILIDGLEDGEGIVIAESFSRNWKAPDGSKIEKDPLGNILLIPIDYSASSILLEYR